MAKDESNTSGLEQTFKALRSRDPSKVGKKIVSPHPDYKRIPKHNYAPTASVETGSWGTGMARYAATNSGIIYGQPQFFSPVHTPINWQIPSKRLEQYQWARFFYENEPKVASAIDFYSEFPMSDFEHECRNRDVKLHFDKLKDKLELPKWCRLISHEIHLLGDCFPFVEIDCPVCYGTGKVGDEICEHEGGTIRRIVILNPDYVEVHTTSINPEPMVALRPDEELINMVQRKMPGYEKLSPEVIALISSGQPIRLDNRNVSHLKYGECGYQKFGIGMVRRLFPILSYKTKLMVAQWIVAERLIVPIKIVKVGSDERPAGPADIADVQAQLSQTANDPNLTIVTHHAFDLDFVGACYDKDTEVLTENGWKRYDDVSKNYDEKIATYNLNNNMLEYKIPQEYHEYSFDGDMCHFEGEYIDVCVTPNHRMLAAKPKWNVKTKKCDIFEWGAERADNIIVNTQFKNTLDWEGYVPDELPYKSECKLKDLSLDDYLKFLGFYISGGSIKVDNEKSNAVQICQCANNECFADIDSIMEKLCKVQKTLSKREKYGWKDCMYWLINDVHMARQMQEKYGHKAPNKTIPRWVLNLPKRELSILLTALMNGDGNVRFSENREIIFKYTTTSKQLSDEVLEIVTKLGYSAQTSFEPKTKDSYHDKYLVYWSDLKSKIGYSVIRSSHIKREKYYGKVWCFTVSNGYFVTRRNGKVGIHGNSGRVLTLSNEFEFINQEILDGMMINNALLNGEGPNFCLSDCSRVLCDTGLKYRDEIDIEKDLIATFNKETGELEYQKAIRKYEYEWNSIDGDSPPLKHFKTNRIDMLVTPNHRMLWAERKLTTNPDFKTNRIDMLVTPNHRMLWAERKLTTNPGEGAQKVNGQKEGFGDWIVSEAENVKVRGRFRSCFDSWNGITKDKGLYFGLKTPDFLSILGWYVSEGYRCFNKKKTKIIGINIAQSESANYETYCKIKKTFVKCGIVFSETSRRDSFNLSSKKSNKKLIEYLSSNCGGYSNTKCIPKEIKNMSQDNLRILLDALVDVDGSERPATKKKPTDKKYYSYITVSRQLRDDVIEILFKLGYSPRFNTIEFDSNNLQTQYTISWTDTNLGKFPVLDSRKWDNKNKKCNSKLEEVISDEDYVGKVWCVEVPNHFILTERNGLFGIHGNSSAAVGIEAMIQRLNTFRGEIAKWIEKHLYLPEAKRQGFVETNPETGEEEYIVPKIKWGSMHLRDQQQYRTFVIQLYDKGLLSAQTVLEAFDLDPDQEIERKRYDALQFMAIGQGFGPSAMGGAGGGGFSGMPPLGGGGGDMGGGPPIGAPGGEMGGPGTPVGGPPSPVGGGVGGPMPKSSPITAEVANPNQFGGKVLKKKTRDRIQSEQKKIFRQQEIYGVMGTDKQGYFRDEKGRITFTKAERGLIPKLMQAQKDGLLKEAIYPQYRVQAAGQEYALDFGIPELKIGIEADGEVFHGSKDQIERDQARDMKLQQQGWTILRFTDTEIERQGPQIVRTVLQEIMRKRMWLEKNAQDLKAK
jgi:very-short-patch-repair endonuclease